MRFLAVIQARSGSTRLPGKVLKDICGRPQLEWVIRRVEKCDSVDKVIVATTNLSADEAVVQLCDELGVESFTGSENDVLDRFYQAVRSYNPEYVIRITADCPCFDPDLLEEAIGELRPETDYLAMVSETFPDGLDLEIIRWQALSEAWAEADMASEREHVTQFIVKRPERYYTQDFISKLGYHGDERWTVDEPQDFELVCAIYKHFLAIGNEEFGYEDILTFLNENPNLRKINAGFSRNEGLVKSLAEDKKVETPDTFISEG